MTIAISLNVFSGMATLALATAQIELPPDLDGASDRISITGFGGYNKGAFQLAEYSGEFARGESRLAVRDPVYVSNQGRSSFSMRQTDAQEIVSADCGFSRKSVTIEVVTFDPKKFSYQCEFRQSGKLLEASLVVGQPKAEGFKQRFVAQDVRRGEASLFDQKVRIESVHKYKGTKLQSPSAVGYLISQDSRVVAALQLTDVNPTIFVARDLPDALRPTIYATALALAVLRDPASSALED